MTKKQPFFTIAIPSLNRIESMKLVINSILKQSFKSYEILIVDDHSTDDIKGYTDSLKSPKIRFIQNKTRQGFKKIFIKSLLEAQGKYVMTLGNDDILCDKDTLQHTYEKLKKREVGLAKLGLIYYYKSPKAPCFSTKLEVKDKYIKNTNYKAIFQAIDDYGVTHIAGTIYLRQLITKNSFLDNELIPFFKTIVDTATEKGFLFIANEYIATGMSTSYLSLFSQKQSYKEAWFYVMYETYSKYIDQKKVKQMIVQKMRQQLPYLVAIKSYVGIHEVRMLIQEYITFERQFLYDFKVYMSFLIAVSFPKPLFLFIRDYRYKKATKAFIPPKKYFNVFHS